MPFAENIRRGKQRREHFDSFNFPQEFCVSMGDIFVTYGVHQISRAMWRSWLVKGWITETSRGDKDSRGLRIYFAARAEE